MGPWTFHLVARRYTDYATPAPGDTQNNHYALRAWSSAAKEKIVWFFFRPKDFDNKLARIHQDT